MRKLFQYFGKTLLNLRILYSFLLQGPDALDSFIFREQNLPVRWLGRLSEIHVDDGNNLHWLLAPSVDPECLNSLTIRSRSKLCVL